jgi:hypothetical protein
MLDILSSGETGIRDERNGERKSRLSDLPSRSHRNQKETSESLSEKKKYQTEETVCLARCSDLPKQQQEKVQWQEGQRLSWSSVFSWAFDEWP